VGQITVDAVFRRMADTVERVTEENGLVPDIEGMERTASGREKTIVDETPGWRSCRRVNPNRWCGRSKGQETGSLAMGDAARAPATYSGLGLGGELQKAAKGSERRKRGEAEACMWWLFRLGGFS
jgi:hypothetical protein